MPYDDIAGGDNIAADATADDDGNGCILGGNE
jgi:hypothetical protein